MLGFLAGIPGKLKTLTDRLSATWAAKLDALRTGLTDTRMGYLDKLNIAGNVAGSDEVAKPASQMTGIIKSIQHGTITVSIAAGSYSSSNTATLGTSVTTSKAFVVCLGASASGTVAEQPTQCRAALTNSTTVTCNASRVNSTGTNNYTVGFVVVEFY